MMIVFRKECILTNWRNSVLRLLARAKYHAAVFACAFVWLLSGRKLNILGGPNNIILFCSFELALLTNEHCYFSKDYINIFFG